MARRELIRLLDGARNQDAARGIVHFVSAHGDPDLLTLKAHRLLQRADVVTHDALVSPELLALARRASSSRRPQCRRGGLAGIAVGQRLVAEARTGRNVVRLRGADSPTGIRDNEEVEALTAARMVVELVPGVALAAGEEFSCSRRRARIMNDLWRHTLRIHAPYAGLSCRSNPQ